MDYRDFRRACWVAVDALIVGLAWLFALYTLLDGAFQAVGV